MITNAGAEAYSVQRSVMRVPESYYVRDVIHCTLMIYSRVIPVPSEVITAPEVIQAPPEVVPAPTEVNSAPPG
jgi:hypothetical protein